MQIAVLENNVVINTIEAESVEFAQNLLGKTCLEITDDSLAGIGWTYDTVKKVCIAPKPYLSWTLNSSNVWVAPMPMPAPKEGAGEIAWDEDSLSWVEQTA